MSSLTLQPKQANQQDGLPVPLVSPLGFTVLSPDGEDYDLDIVFVHGLNGNAADTWVHPTTKLFWPHQLVRDFGRARVMAFGYDALFSRTGNTIRIREIAEELLYGLSERRIGYEGRPLVIIGHSLGGLVIKQALFLSHTANRAEVKAVHPAVKEIFFYGTPHLGSSVDKKKRVMIVKGVASVVGYKVPPQLEEALASHSHTSLDLSDDFGRLPGIHGLSIRTFYETVKTPKLGELVVDKASARVGTQNESLRPIQANHTDIVKFSGVGDTRYFTVKAHMQQIIKIIGNENVNIAGNMENDVFQTQPKHIDTRILQSRVPAFIGRNTILATIKTKFQPIFTRERINPFRIAFVGIGGIGKTQTMLQYYKQARQSREFGTYFWINTSTEDGLKAAFSTIGKIIRSESGNFPTKAGLDPHQRYPDNEMEDRGDNENWVEYSIQKFKSWRDPYLLIYDNFDDPEINIEKYIPSIGPTAVLITSRQRDLINTYFVNEGCEVPVISDSEALELLSARMGKHGKLVEEYKDNAMYIVACLGHLPLAIAQAATYIVSGGRPMPFPQFIHRFKEERKSILQKVPRFWEYKKLIIEDGKAREACMSVFTTWELSLKRLTKDNSLDEQRICHFLTLCAFFNHRRIPRVIFEKHFEVRLSCPFCSKMEGWMYVFANSKEEFDIGLFHDSVVELRDLFLIEDFMEPSTECFYLSMHPLVRDWTIFRNPPAEQQSYCAEASQILNDAVLSISHDSPDYSEWTIGKLFCSKLGIWEDPDSMSIMIRDTMQEFYMHMDSIVTWWSKYDWKTFDLDFKIVSSWKGLALLAEANPLYDRHELFLEISKDQAFGVSGSYINEDFELHDLDGFMDPKEIPHFRVFLHPTRHSSLDDIESWLSMMSTQMWQAIFHRIWGTRKAFGWQIRFFWDEKMLAICESEESQPELYLIGLAWQISILFGPNLGTNREIPLTLHETATKILDFASTMRPDKMQFGKESSHLSILLLLLSAQASLGTNEYFSETAITLARKLISLQDESSCMVIADFTGQFLQGNINMSRHEWSAALPLYENAYKYLCGVQGSNSSVVMELALKMVECQIQANPNNATGQTLFADKLVKLPTESHYELKFRISDLFSKNNLWDQAYQITVDLINVAKETRPSDLEIPPFAVAKLGYIAIRAILDYSGDTEITTKWLHRLSALIPSLISAYKETRKYHFMIDLLKAASLYEVRGMWKNVDNILDSLRSIIPALDKLALSTIESELELFSFFDESTTASERHLLLKKDLANSLSAESKLQVVLSKERNDGYLACLCRVADFLETPDNHKDALDLWMRIVSYCERHVNSNKYIWLNAEMRIIVIYQRLREHRQAMERIMALIRVGGATYRGENLRKFLNTWTCLYIQEAKTEGARPQDIAPSFPVGTCFTQVDGVTHEDTTSTTFSLLLVHEVDTTESEQRIYLWLYRIPSMEIEDMGVTETIAETLLCAAREHPTDGDTRHILISFVSRNCHRHDASFGKYMAAGAEYALLEQDFYAAEDLSHKALQCFERNHTAYAQQILNMRVCLILIYVSLGYWKEAVLAGNEVAEVVSTYPVTELRRIVEESGLESNNQDPGKSQMSPETPRKIWLYGEQYSGLLASGLFLLSRMIVASSAAFSSGNQLLGNYLKSHALRQIHVAISACFSDKSNPLLRLFSGSTKMQLGNFEFSSGQYRQASLSYEESLPLLEGEALQEEGYVPGEEYGPEAIRSASENWRDCREKIENDIDKEEEESSVSVDVHSTDQVEGNLGSLSQAWETSQSMKYKEALLYYTFEHPMGDQDPAD